MYVREVLGAIPHILNTTEYCRIDGVEFLKLINDKIEFLRLTYRHNQFEKLHKRLYAFGHKASQRLPHRLREVFAQGGFVVATHEKIQRGRILATFNDQFGLADATSPRHHRHLRMVREGTPLDFGKLLQLLFSIVKLHSRFIL
jgi:hypothetical protein